MNVDSTAEVKPLVRRRWGSPTRWPNRRGKCVNASEPVEALLQRVSLIPDLGGASYPDESAVGGGPPGPTPTRAPGPNAPVWGVRARCWVMAEGLGGGRLQRPV